MKKRAAMSERIVHLLEKDSAGMLNVLGRMSDMLVGFRYEGKPSFGKNVKKAKSMLRLLNQEWAQHAWFEEKILFPFIGVHLPKLESMILVLKADHLDFKKVTRQLRSLLNRMSAMNSVSRYGEWIQQVNESGTYLIYFLRHHLEARKEGIEKIIESELRENEKKELASRIKRLGGLRPGVPKKIFGRRYVER